MAENVTTAIPGDQLYPLKSLVLGLTVGLTILLLSLYICLVSTCAGVCIRKIKTRRRLAASREEEDRRRILRTDRTHVDPVEIEMGIGQSTSLFKGENFVHNPAFLNAELEAIKEDRIEFPKSNVCILRELGETTFGPISLGEATGLKESELSTTVLIKILKLGASKKIHEEFDNELRWASSFSHPGILQLLGVCIRDEPKYLIYEYLEYGTLKHFLQSTASVMGDLNHILDSSDGGESTAPLCHPILDNEILLSFGVQIASAANYMTEKGFVHQDLAARNVHVGSNMNIKVANFGFSRDVRSHDYYHMKDIRDKLLPVRWLAPETLKEGIYSPETDVWSFGVVLWEIFNCAQMPYKNVSNPDVIQRILKAKPLPRPKNCPDSVYRIMLACWLREPRTRPNFTLLEEQLSKLVELSKRPKSRGWTWKMRLKRQQKLKLHSQRFNPPEQSPHQTH